MPFANTARKAAIKRAAGLGGRGVSGPAGNAPPVATPNPLLGGMGNQGKVGAPAPTALVPSNAPNPLLGGMGTAPKAGTITASPVLGGPQVAPDRDFASVQEGVAAQQNAFPQPGIPVTRPNPLVSTPLQPRKTAFRGPRASLPQMPVDPAQQGRALRQFQGQFSDTQQSAPSPFVAPDLSRDQARSGRLAERR